MQAWRSKLLSFTGMFTLFAIWTPLFWFISWARAHNRMEAFEVFELPWPATLAFTALAIATMLAQFGLVLITHEHAKASSRDD